MKKMLLILNIVLFAAVASGCARTGVDAEGYSNQSCIDDGKVYKPVKRPHIKKDEADFVKLPWTVFYDRRNGLKSDFVFGGPAMLSGTQYIVKGLLKVDEFEFRTFRNQRVEGEYSVTVEPTDNVEVLFWHSGLKDDDDNYIRDDAGKIIYAGYKLNIFDGVLSLFRIQSQEFVPLNSNQVSGGAAKITFYSVKNRHPVGTYTYVLSVNDKIAVSFIDVPSKGDIVVSHGLFSEIKFRGPEVPLAPSFL